MPDPIHAEPEASVTQLVSGIVKDLQDLVKQQMALLRHEVQQDLHRTLQSMGAIAAGLGFLLLGVILAVGLTLVHLLHWAAEPTLPLWACYAIVGLVLSGIGAALAYAGIRKFRSFNPLPDETAAALKENVQWLMNPK